MRGSAASPTKKRESRAWREKFLDEWWSTSPNLYKQYHSTCGGNGKRMIIFLEEYETIFYSHILDKMR